MKMYLALGLFCCSGLLVVNAATLTPDERAAITDAGQNGAKAKVVFRVVDDTGASVQDARGFFGFFCGGEGQVRMTDKDGIAVAEHKCRDEVVWRFTKDGYYKSEGSVKTWRYEKGALQDGKWQPYGATNTVVLKRIRNPIAMRACDNLKYYEYPTNAPMLGFDLAVGDWVVPYGKGRIADFVVRHTSCEKNYYEFSCQATLVFTNRFDGVCVVKKDVFSEFPFAYHADTNAIYRKEFLFTREGYANGKIVGRELAKDEYFVFRTRTHVDVSGRLVAANYSVVGGPMLFMMGLRFVGGCHFNPTPNDTNLEFDPDKNLSDDGDWRHKTHFAP